METLISSEEPSSSLESTEVETEVEGALSAHMEWRKSEYRHVAMAGEEITEDWPPPGTPSWSQWLEVHTLASRFEGNYKSESHLLQIGSIA